MYALGFRTSVVVLLHNTFFTVFAFLKAEKMILKTESMISKCPSSPLEAV